MDRFATILEQARAVNGIMVIAYCLIGREIVEELRGGESCAEYGKGLLVELSRELTNRCGQGFSVVNLRHVRLFY